MIYYLVGIKGSGMSALAHILIDLGHIVKGVDSSTFFYTAKSLKAKIETFDNYMLKKEYFYIIGNAFVNHKISKEIISNNYMYEYYPKFINKYIDGIKITVSGTHGKTTTTTFLSKFINCNYLIGNGDGKGINKSKYFLFEACEYKNTFLNYDPYLCIILNIDYDHPDFFKNKEDYVKSFYKFMNKSKIIIYNGDLINLNHNIKEKAYSFGFKCYNDLVCDYILINNKYILSLKYKNKKEVLSLNILGIHNIYNFLACYLTLKVLNINIDDMYKTTLSLKLPYRRFNDLKVKDNIVISDYSHHPTEIKAFYDIVKLKYKSYKKILIFEPHTYSRTEKFYNDFLKSFSLFDEVYIEKTFSSVREEGEIVYYFSSKYKCFSDDVFNNLLEYHHSCICFVGAGNINKKCNLFIASLNSR